MFEAIYDSAWHNPALFWLAAIVFLAVVTRRLPFLIAYSILFAVDVLADTLATGGWSPLTYTKSPWMTPIAIVFVILGDLRFFLVLERYWTPGRRWSGALPRAGAWSLLVPILSYVPQPFAPALFSDARVTFLVYEAMFVVLALVIRLVLLPRRLGAVPEAVRRWLTAVVDFEIAQYAGWALADIVILAGMSWGFLLRLVPNIMYYALFLPFVWWKAPAEEKSWGPARG